MPWRPEDWKEWPAERWVATYSDAAHVRAVRDIVVSLPSSSRGSVTELTRGPEIWCPFLAAHFARVTPVTLNAGDTAQELPGAADVVVAVDTIDAREVPRLLPVVHESLVEGGVLLATLPATAGRSRPFDMIGPRHTDGIHEVELQYRLRRAGFQGVRLRRFRGGTETLLCMAVRRALN